MNQKTIFFTITFLLVSLPMYAWWGMPETECERLVKASQSNQSFPVCMKLAKQGNAYAQNIVGTSYADGEGVEQDAQLAFYWFQKSADQNFAKAQSNMGLAYLGGSGVQQSHTEAIRWWRLAALQAEPNAQFNLAVSFANGYGVNQDIGASNRLMLSSMLSYLKLGNLERVFSYIKYIQIESPWVEPHAACSTVNII